MHAFKHHFFPPHSSGLQSFFFPNSWTKEPGQSAEEIPGEPPATSLISEKRETSGVKPSSDSRLSEKFLAPSKTPDNGQTEYGGDKSDRSPWSFSGDSLLFQTPRPAGDISSFAKVRASHRSGKNSRARNTARTKC